MPEVRAPQNEAENKKKVIEQKETFLLFCIVTFF